MRIFEPKPFWKGWYSHKFKSAGLHWKVASSIRSGDICWINGPFPCGKYPDIKIFCMGLMHELGPGEKVEADNGYRGQCDCVWLPHEGNASLHEKAVVRAWHEGVNKRLKQFAILTWTYCHDQTTHGAAFWAVAVVTQLAIENGQPLYDVAYNSLM